MARCMCLISGLIAIVVSAAACTPMPRVPIGPTLAPFPTWPMPDMTSLAGEGEAIEIVAATIRSRENRADFERYAIGTYIGGDIREVRFGVGASWQLIEPDRVTPLTELAANFADEVRDEPAP